MYIANVNPFTKVVENIDTVHKTYGVKFFDLTLSNEDEYYKFKQKAGMDDEFSYKGLKGNKEYFSYKDLEISISHKE